MSKGSSLSCRSFVSESPSGPQLFDHSDDDQVRFHIAHAAGTALMLVGPRGIVRAEAIAGDDVELCFDKDDLGKSIEESDGVSWVRPEVHAAGGAVQALGQAIRL